MIEWRKIPGFSRYEASVDGYLRSTNYKRSGKTKVLKPALDGCGYLRTVLLRDDGIYKNGSVHLWVAVTFCGPRVEGMQVNHKNGIKTDNRSDNLEWVTRSENAQHAFDNGLAKGLSGENNPASKLTSEQVRFLRNEKATKGRFWGRNEYAKQYGIAAKHLQKIVNNHEGIWAGV